MAVNEPATLPEAEDSDQDERRRGGDVELLTMGRIVRMVEALEEPARGRVVRWLSDRYEGKI